MDRDPLIWRPHVEVLSASKVHIRCCSFPQGQEVAWPEVAFPARAISCREVCGLRARVFPELPFEVGINMYRLSVLQVVDPSCFFCEILKEGESNNYEQLFDELNFLYSTIYRDIEELRPVSLPVGTFCVVFCEEMKSWCRAIFESTTCSAQDELVDCFLLDFAIYCAIKKNNIRFPVEQCQKLPFRAKKFKLHHIRPISLCINVLENKSELRPAKYWDSAAIHYFRQLLNESLKIEAQLCSVENNCMTVYLYLTTTDSVICANDDLVAKKYACYENRNLENKIENSNVLSTAHTLQNGLTSFPFAGTLPQSLEKQDLKVQIAAPNQCEELSSSNQSMELAEKILIQKSKAMKETRMVESLNKEISVSLRKEHPESASENVAVIYPQPKESVSKCPTVKDVTSPNPFISLAWLNPTPGHILHTEPSENYISDKSETAIQHGNNAVPIKCQKENTSNSVSEDDEPLVFEKVRAWSPQYQLQALSESPQYKDVTSPDSSLCPVLDKTDPAQGLHTDHADNAVAEIRLKSEEKLDQAVRDSHPPLETESSVEVDPAQFIWPSWSNRDHTRRLSSEITATSFAKLSSVSDNKPILMKEVDKKQGLTRLLQFLSPTPMQLPEEESKKPPKIINPDGAIFASTSLAPVSSLEETSLCADIKKRLILCGYDGPNLTESYCWAPIAEGFDTIVISPDGSNPVYYLPPLLSYLSCAAVIYKLLPTRLGPHAVIICPGWNKAHAVYNLLKEFSKYMRPLGPMLLLVGHKKEDIESFNFRKQCEVIVTTPHCMLRCLEHHGLLLLRLCHLVFDEVDVLFSKAGSEMLEILQLYKKIVTAENRDGTPQQIVAVGSKWIPDMQLLLQYTSTPRIVITRMEQAAVFANVQQVIQLCLNCEKMSVLLQCLDFTPINAQKIIIFTKNDDEAELVHKAVQSASVYSLLLHKSLVHTFSHILEQWKKSLSRRTVMVLVVTDDYAPLLEITDATSIIHYSFPENVGVLNLRLFSLMDYIQCRIDKVTMEEDGYSRAKSILLMTEKHASCAIDLLKSFQQAQSTVPPELVALAQGLLHSWENKKQDEELCPYLKTFGYCNQDIYACPHRHHINPSCDHHCGEPPMPNSKSYITVLPLHIVDAARFYGRVITKNDPYDKLYAELNQYYQSQMNNIPAQKVSCKHLYAISDGSSYHRVQVLSTETVDSVLYAQVQYIDDGKTDKIPVHMFFLLPSVFQSVPPLYREFIVCRVKPIDNEDKWDPKVTRLITRCVRGKQHLAKVVFNIGKTYWLDPMVQVTTLSDLTSCVYDLNVRQEILSTGLGTDNPQHILRLKALLETSSVSQVSVSSEETTKILCEKSTEALNVVSPLCLESADSATRNMFVGGNFSSHADEEKEHFEEIDGNKHSEPTGTVPSTSLYPVVKWFEKDDNVILTVKLQQVTNPKCAFYSDRLVFSCYAEGKHYVADMELHKEIIGDKSECTIRGGEAVITILKSKAETWNKLLKHKHPNVSFDFDHFEDSEDNEVYKSGYHIPKKFYNVVSEDLISSEYSESESD
ncbi:putative ATP-dependent RNA helicase TDRD12 isoform X1 [Engystomops pustulosus]|uniref:putative ATP-dependent RNA helicase TDRD12 isoform X1 n=2 Tax=Engystomops pustulosus TaxID=76066 RepID=UPI003AFB0F09